MRNGQPLGGLIGLGSSPSSIIRFLDFPTSGSGIGTALNNAFVYGCIGFAYSSFHGDGRDRKSQFEHRAPGLAAFEIPGVPLAAGSGAAGGYAREEIDADECHGTCHQRAYGGEQGDEARREAANESV